MIAIGSNYNILCVSNMLYSKMNGGSFYSCCIPVYETSSFSVYMWLGSSGPDQGPVGHTGSMGLVVGPRASLGLIIVYGQFCFVNLWGCAMSGWIQVCSMFSP